MQVKTIAVYTKTGTKNEAKLLRILKWNEVNNTLYNKFLLHRTRHFADIKQHKKNIN